MCKQMQMHFYINFHDVSVHTCIVRNWMKLVILLPPSLRFPGWPSFLGGFWATYTGNKSFFYSPASSWHQSVPGRQSASGSSNQAGASWLVFTQLAMSSYVNVLEGVLFAWKSSRITNCTLLLYIVHIEVAHHWTDGMCICGPVFPRRLPPHWPLLMSLTHQNFHVCVCVCGIVYIHNHRSI